MQDHTATPPVAYPPTLTIVEMVELASALSYHFDQCEHGKTFCDMGVTDMSRATQYEIVCGVVHRMLRRRAGLL